MTPNSIKLNYDFNPGLRRSADRESMLWFYGSARWVKTQNYVGGMFVQQERRHPERSGPTIADFDQPAFVNATQQSVNLRLTWQASTEEQVQLLLRTTRGGCQCANVNASDIARSGHRDQVSRSSGWRRWPGHRP